MEVKIRKATADDAKGIARVHVDAWKSTYRDWFPTNTLTAFRMKAGSRCGRR